MEWSEKATGIFLHIPHTLRDTHFKRGITKCPVLRSIAKGERGRWNFSASGCHMLDSGTKQPPNSLVHRARLEGKPYEPDGNSLGVGRWEAGPIERAGSWVPVLRNVVKQAHFFPSKARISPWRGRLSCCSFGRPCTESQAASWEGTGPGARGSLEGAGHSPSLPDVFGSSLTGTNQRVGPRQEVDSHTGRCQGGKGDNSSNVNCG